MTSKSNLIAMIPARIGSTRLKMKNLALINGEPLIYYSIIAAKESKIFDRIILNSDSDIFKEIANRYDVEFYKRPFHLGGNKTKSDDVVYDFLKHNSTEIVVWVNPISPLQTAKQIKEIVHYFNENKLDSLITVKDEQVHCIYKNEAVNYKLNGKFAQTQELTPVKPFVYSIMMWRTDPFLFAMREKGSAFFTGNIGYYTVDKYSSMIVKTAEDLIFAENILRTRSEKTKTIKYDDIIEKVENTHE